VGLRPYNCIKSRRSINNRERRSTGYIRSDIDHHHGGRVDRRGDIVSKPKEITYFIRHNDGHCCIKIVKKLFFGYYMTIRRVSSDSAVIYNSANEVDVMRVLRVYGALKNPAVSLMFPHWRVEEEKEQGASDS